MFPQLDSTARCTIQSLVVELQVHAVVDLICEFIVRS